MIKALLTIFFSLAITLTMSGLKSLAEHDQDNKQKTVVVGNVAGEGENKGKIQCPVMKTWFVPDEKTDKVIYEGKTYYFCCKGCKPTFEKDPQKYVKG